MIHLIMLILNFLSAQEPKLCLKATGVFYQNDKASWIEGGKGSRQEFQLRFQTHQKNLRPYNGVNVVVVGYGIRMNASRARIDSILTFELAPISGLELSVGQIEELPPSNCQTK